MRPTPLEIVAGHEAVHVCLAFAAGGSPLSARIDNPEPGVQGQAKFEASQAGLLVASLGAYLWEGRTDWPPTFEDARTETREGIGDLLRAGDWSEDGYKQCIAVARLMLDDTDIRRAIRAVQFALITVRVLNAAEIADLLGPILETT